MSGFARSILLLLCVGVSGVAGVTHAAPAGPAGMPDPRQMSGIPRPDPQLSAGTVTVRVLRGGFDEPALEHAVELEVQGTDGRKQTRQGKTDDAKGRAVFDGLEAFVGGQAVAKVVLDGETLESRPIPLLAEAGSAVMLVAGAATTNDGAAAPSHGQPGGPSVPMPGNAFPLPDSPPGQLTVGTFDLAAKAPVAEVEVQLEIKPPEGEPIVRRGTTDIQGKFIFNDLLPPKIPDGSKLVVSAILREGGQQRTSEPFEMNAEGGMALVLAEGTQRWQADEAHAQAGTMSPARSRLPAPRILPALTPGTVRVRLVDPNDGPVANQEVVIVQTTAEGTGATWRGRTGFTGMAEVEGIEVRSDALYAVKVLYDGAPYQSSLFGLDKRGGVAVDLRLFEVTADPSVVRSALQVDVTGLENDHAQVVHIYEAIVEGDKAFWPGSMKIPAMPGAKGLVVMRRAEAWLEHEEKADFVKLAGPLPPGEVINMTFGYLVEHDGVLGFDWTTPFDLVETAVIVAPDQELDAPGARQADPLPQMPDKQVFTLGPRQSGSKIEFSLGGLPITNPIFRRLGVLLALVMAIAAVIGIVSKPRRSARERLVRRRDELLAHLERLGTNADHPRRQPIVAALDRVYRQLRALEDIREPKRPPPGEEARE